MKIKLTVVKTTEDKFMVNASTSVTNGSMRPKKKELAFDAAQVFDDLDGVKAFIGKIITDPDAEGKIGTK